ncbi:MAG: 4-hydroxy-2-oxovalerate/4-hydroxy-2-oxohexanoate aldolase [Bradymonadia bacterium]|jgi:4-hydroxy-2-oxovalerate/4-hydroxy-2-oxohexanoate aldolase
MSDTNTADSGTANSDTTNAASTGTVGAKRDIVIHENTLRDGMHAVRHQYTVDQMVAISTALDAAGVPLIEIAHGDGLGGSSINYGFAKHEEREYLEAVCPLMTQAKISALSLPGIGTVDEIAMAIDCGVSCLRIATHCTEADIAVQHLRVSRDAGMDTVGFLMMAHMLDPAGLAEQARIMVDQGAQCVYVTDSAGHLLPDGVTARVKALIDAVPADVQVGFHGHHNMAMGVANSVAAVRAGAHRIDTSCAGLGAGAGNTPTEAFVAVCNHMGIETGVDLFGVMDVAEDLVVPLTDQPVRVDRDSLTLGYAGVYSSFLLFAKRAEARYGIPAHELLMELGRRKTVGGQEDRIEDLALEMKRQREG